MISIIGIDPGQKGGLAIITHNDVKIIAMPMAGKEINVIEIDRWIASILKYNDPSNTPIAYIEKVHSMPRQGVASSFKFGYNVGILHGCIRTLQIPLKLVTPQRWKKEILYGTAKDKDAAIDYCVRTFPGISLLATERSRVPHDGMADALCIAQYGWLQENK